METVYKNCQSCGMPMKKDPEGGGTNSDGSKSTTYCSKCFQNGQFTNPTMTVQEMQTRVKQKLGEMHFPKFVASWFARGIPKLKRWAK
jgi:agmatine/peptidylarginine deiminase